MGGVWPSGEWEGYLGAVMEMTPEQLELITKTAIEDALSAVSHHQKVDAKDHIGSTSYSRGKLTPFDVNTISSYIRTYINAYRGEVTKLGLSNKEPKTIYIKNFSGLRSFEISGYYKSFCIIIDNCDVHDFSTSFSNSFSHSIQNSYVHNIACNSETTLSVINCTIQTCQNSTNINFQRCQIDSINRLGSGVFENCKIKKASGLVNCTISNNSIILESLTAASGKLAMQDCEIEGILSAENACSPVELIRVTANKVNVYGKHFIADSLTGEINSKSTNFRLKNSLALKKLTISDCEALEMQDCIIKESTNVKGCNFSEHATFSNIIFNQAPTFDAKTQFSSKNIEFSNCTFTQLNSGAALGAYRSLKSICQDADYEHGVILFHGLELETYRNTHLTRNKWTEWLWSKPCQSWKDRIRLKPDKDLPEKVASLIHKHFTDYGRDTMLPFRWLFWIWLAGVLVNILSSCTPFEVDYSPFLYSTKNSLGPLIFALPKEIRELHLCGSSVFFAFFQIAFSSIIWFLIIFMIRRRFKI
jgi:hypothetical protein